MALSGYKNKTRTKRGALMAFTSVEMCAGAGGQAIGLESAGFEHTALVEIEPRFCETLKLNRPKWNVCEQDLAEFDGRPYKGADLLAGGLPCPPFSVAGKQLGSKDERNLFPSALRLIDEIKPKAVSRQSSHSKKGMQSSIRRSPF
jgi:DNA (cytosine-5)-methyltransferase 1